MKAVFVDAGPFVAMANKRDQFREHAISVWHQLAELALPLVSSDHVLNEVATSICRAESPDRAARWVRMQLTGNLVRWIQPEPEDLLEAAKWLEKFSDQRVNFTDALSFVLMKKERIEEAVTFDRHFSIAGFRIFAEA